MYSAGCHPAFARCIVAFCTEGGAISCYSASGSPVFTCSDIHGNTGGDWVGHISDQSSVDGNFSADPLFCDVYNDDYALCANSPCLPGGNGCGVLIGARGKGCPDCNSPVEQSSWGAVKAMYR